MTDDKSSQTEDARLRALLAQPQPPADLPARIRTNLAASAPQNSARRYTFRVAVLAAISLAGASLFTLRGTKLPEVVNAAYADMLKDRPLQGTYNNPDLWLSTKALRLPRAMSVDLSKDCMLDGVVAKHLRLVNARLGPVNVFVFERLADAQLAAAHGAVADQHWLLLEPRPGMVVIALYDDATKRDSVMDIVAQMFATPTRA